jgi:hypothetical protein
MQNKRLNIQPIAIPAAVANLLNPTLTSAAGGVGIICTQPYVLIRHMRVVNKTALPVAVTLYKGGTGGAVAGTEFAWNGAVVPANGFLDWSGELRLDTGDFLTGLAGTVTALVLNVDQAEIGFSG